MVFLEGVLAGVAAVICATAAWVLAPVLRARHDPRALASARAARAFAERNPRAAIIAILDDYDLRGDFALLRVYVSSAVKMRVEPERIARVLEREALRTPDDAELRHDLAVALEDAGRREEAEIQWSTLLTLDGGAWADRARSMLRG